jgi:DNA-binding NtrC family response regulator
LPKWQKEVNNMGLLREELNMYQPIGNRIEALKALTKLILHEVESLEEISPAKTVESEEATINLPDKVQRYEANLIRHALFSVNGNQSKAARKLGMKITTLHAKIKRYDIESIGFLR